MYGDHALYHCRQILIAQNYTIYLIVPLTKKSSNTCSKIPHASILKQKSWRLALGEEHHSLIPTPPW